MPYCTATDYAARYGEDELIQRTDRLGTGVMDTVVFDQAAADADAEIDGYLAGRYTLPLAGVPSILVRLACDIVRYRLFIDKAPEEVRKRYEDARRLLENLAAGRITLGLPGAGPAPVPAGDLVEIAPGRKVFGGGV